MKSDFTSKLAITRLGLNFSTSLVNETKSFIVCSLMVIGLSN